ncbi:endonuclease MutS2 [Streptococcus merionis]|uniref:Endonuclease MutS2 n=1 Tax=Streptococcus merionis TaxID=400065 RepID=A0A239SM74_9STRE|nr:endonuclease MutS2 [Streptococcus merionis]SNU85948.1 mismatch repair ATPase [Streptococcus merionis]
MNQKILDTLEFGKVKSLFQPFLVTAQGRNELVSLAPTAETKRIQVQFEEMREMAELFVESPHFALGETSDISGLVARLALEGQLNIEEFLALKRLLEVSKHLKEFYEDLENVQLEQLSRLFENLEVFPHLQGSLQAINDAGFVESFASPELAKIRRTIQESEEQARQVMQDILKKQGEMLVEAIIVNRNGRNVLPVKNTYRNRISGIVHDISSSGTTVYIEPRAVVNLNEAITNARADERHEINRILTELSAMVQPYHSSFKNNAWLIGHIDLVRAKHLFARKYQATVPSISEEQAIQLLNVRHPLLEKPVPNDLYFGKDLAALVITGPNTGGKTIILKTLGLSQIMAQAGLPILADQGSRIGIFEEVYADIGDEQSIEQSLSTFSSHMTNIVRILDEVNDRSLVLFDELGAGTDPQEGAALAMAILDDLRLRGIKTMATTHYPELKAYGIHTPHVENASMEFDTTTLSPTYRFMQGVPGRSNAFEIAKRLGLSSIIVKEAQSQTLGNTDVNQIIEKLEQQTAESRRRLDNIKAVEQENLKFNRVLKKLYNEFSREKENELDKARVEAQEIVNLALEESEEILKHLHDQAQLKPHQIIEAKTQLKSLVPEQKKLAQNKVLKKAKAQRAVKVGDDITVTAYGQRGTLTSQLKDGRWEAQVGLIKMTLKADEFELVKKEEPQVKAKQVNVVKRSNVKGPSARLDLRGKRYEEAMQELDEFIDQALLNNMAQVDIIHGIGTGVIREGVTKYLRRNKNVKTFGYAPQNAGGSGCTIVVFQ